MLGSTNDANQNPVGNAHHPRAMKTRILLRIVIAVLASSIAGFAQENTAKSGEESKLVFVIEPVKTTYAKGENVEFTFRLSNRSGDKVLVAKTFQLAHFVTLDIVNAEGKRAEWCGRIAGQTDLPRSFIVLSPGESVVCIRATPFFRWLLICVEVEV